MSAASILATTVASAAPSVYPPSSNKLDIVVNNSPAVVIADHQDSNTLWVLPPNTGSVETSGHWLGANTGFCSSMAIIQSHMEDMNSKRGDYQEDAGEVMEDIAELEQELAEAEAEAAEYYVDEELETVATAYERLEEAEARLDALLDRKSACDLDTDCDTIEAEIEAQRAVVDQLDEELKDWRKEHREDWKAFRKREKLVEKIERKLDRRIKRAQKYQRYISLITGEMLDAYLQFGRLEGGYMNIQFDSLWEDATQQIRDDNPFFNVQKVPTKDVRINMQLVPVNSSGTYVNSGESILGYSVNGRSGSTADIDDTLPSLPETMGGNVRLSLVGACPIASPGLFPVATANDGNPLFGLTASYKFPSTFRTQASVQYNLWNVYRELKSMKRKGGFFKTKVTKKQSRQLEFGSDTVFSFNDETGMLPSEKQQIKDELMAGIVSELAVLMGIPLPTPMQPETTLDNAPANGATVLADGVRDTCGFNIYCKGVSWILRAASATFGSSESEAQLQQSYNYFITREYSTSEIQWRDGLIGFSQ